MLCSSFNRQPKKDISQERAGRLGESLPPIYRAQDYFSYLIISVAILEDKMYSLERTKYDTTKLVCVEDTKLWKKKAPVVIGRSYTGPKSDNVKINLYLFMSLKTLP